jgi:hypothetical protein
MPNLMFEIIPITIETEGKVLRSNLAEVRESLREGLALINRDLKTDEEFGQAEIDAKKLKVVEEALGAAKAKALEDASALHTLFAQIDEATGEVSTARLELERQIEKRKAEIKNELIADALAKIECAPKHRSPVFGKSIQEAIKGKRTLDTMRKALDVVVACHNALIRKSKALLDAHVVEHGLTLVMDRLDLEVKSPDIVESELQRRVEAHKAEQERKRLEAEAAKAKAETEQLRRSQEATVTAHYKDGSSVVVGPGGILERVGPGCATPTAEPTIETVRYADGRNAVVYHPGTAATPSAPTVESIPTGPDSEWQQMKGVVFDAFMKIKNRRELLSHEINQRRMSVFAEGSRNAFKQAEQIK